MASEEWSHFLKLAWDGEERRRESRRKDRKGEHMRYFTCGPVPAEMMDDGMCTHNLLSRQPLP